MRSYRLVVGVAVAIVVLFALAGSVLADGWAATTLDTLPEGGFQAGQTYRLGYMIRQHGQTPFVGAKTAITIVSPSNRERFVFPGVPDGPPGHYVADVRFPLEGSWDWEVSQEPFAVQTLGTIDVTPVTPAASTSESPTREETASVVPPLVIPLALLLAALTAWPLIAFVRPRRGGSALRLARAIE